MTNEEQLQKLMAECESFGADISINPDHRQYFTARIREEWKDLRQRETAADIQEKIRNAADVYPNVVCYCFDSYSTLLYTI